MSRWFGGMLVDFGFGSLIDKFEERFGRRVTTVLLAVVGLGIFAGCVGLIAGNLIKPSIDLYNATDWPAFKEWLIKHLIPTLVALVILFVLAHLLSRVGEEIYRRTIGRMLARKRAEAEIKRSLAEYKERITKEVSEIGEKAQAEAIATIGDMKQRLLTELYEAIEMRDKAMAVSQEVIETVGSWLSDLDETKPEENIEKSREMILTLKRLKQETSAPDKVEPTTD
jgi:vacuolar-type H+-ATPase subunit E/Vma4